MESEVSLKSGAAQAVPDLESSGAENRIIWARDTFGSGLIMSTSFGIHSAVMLHLVTQEIPDIPVVFIDTGYHFPETYRFPEKVTEKALVERMVQSHLKLWKNITVPDSLKKYSHHEFITLASIVEREATLLSELTRISGVFHNRLRRGYPLGADPTVRFALKKFGGPLRVSELNCNSPYNTRRFPGLPPGPICSPGAGAIKAAVNPMTTRDLYFVAKWDGSGEHDFSETNAEHDRKKHAIRRRNKKRLRRKAAGGK